LIWLREAVVLRGRFPALAGLDLDVEAGEIVLVRGPNGAGKSTLLGLCAGLHRLHSGTAVVLGHDLGVDGASQRSALRRRVGLLGHESALYDDLTVMENLEFWARVARVPVSAAPRALDRLAVNMRLRDMRVGWLSAGQRRRCALAAMVMRRPELWLLDEPYASLDDLARRAVDDLIAEAAASGATVMVASHEAGRVGSLADRTVTLTAGAARG